MVDTTATKGLVSSMTAGSHQWQGGPTFGAQWWIGDAAMTAGPSLCNIFRLVLRLEEIPWRLAWCKWYSDLAKIGRQIHYKQPIDPCSWQVFAANGNGWMAFSPAIPWIRRKLHHLSPFSLDLERTCHVESLATIARLYPADLDNNLMKAIKPMSDHGLLQWTRLGTKVAQVGLLRCQREES